MTSSSVKAVSSPPAGNILIDNERGRIEAEVLREFKKHSEIYDPWFILVVIMYLLLAFCNDLPGGGVFVRFLDEKYRRHRNNYDIVFFVTCQLVIGFMADLYGRRRVCYLLSTTTWLIFIPLTIFTDLKMETGTLVLYKAQHYLIPSVTMVFSINFLEICEQYTKLLITVALLSFAFATETLTLDLDLVYRKSILVFILTVPVFITWYVPESPLWLLNKDKTRAVLKLLKELSGKRPEIVAPQSKDVVKYSQFKIWKESLRYLFVHKWKRLICFVALATAVGICLTHVSYFAVNHSIPVRIPLIVFSILIMVVFYICMKLRLSIFFLNGALFFSEIVHFIYLLSYSHPDTEEVVIVWIQYVLIWAVAMLTLLFMAENFPTFVRVTAVSLVLVIQRLITATLQISGLQDIPIRDYYMSGAKILIYVLLGMIPLLFLSESSKLLLSNEKLKIPADR